MITVLRAKLKGKGFQIVLWVMLIAMGIFWTLPNLFNRMTGGSWVAMVNGQEISYQRFARAVHAQQQRLQEIRQQYGQYADYLMQSMGLSTDPKMLALDVLVQEEVLNQAAARVPLYLNHEYLVRKINDQYFVQSSSLGEVIPRGLHLPQGGLNEQALQAYLKYTRMSMAEFEDSIERALERHNLLELTALGSYVPSFSIKNYYTTMYQGRKFSVLKISFDQALEQEKNQALSDGQIQEFFDQQNKRTKRYFVPEKRSGIVWKFDPQNYGIVVTDQEIESFYQRNKTKEYLDEPTKIEIRRILFRVEDPSQEEAQYKKVQDVLAELQVEPQRFEELARIHSEDTESAQKGGLLAPFAKGQQAKKLERAAFLLENDGEISGIVRTKDGFELLQRVRKIRPTFKPLSSVRSDIRQILMEKKFGNSFARDMKKVLNRSSTTDVNEVSFEQFIKDKKAGKGQSIGPVEAGASQQARELFKTDIDQVTFWVDDNMGYAVKTTEIKKEYLPELDTIKEAVADDLYAQKAAKRVAAKLEKALNQAKNETFDAAHKDLGGEIVTTDFIIASDKDMLEKLQKDGLPVQEMLQMEKVGSVNSALVGSNGYLIRLDAQQPFDAQDFQLKKAEIKKKLEGDRMRLFVEGFVASLLRSATLKSNNALFSASENRTS